MLSARLLTVWSEELTKLRVGLGFSLWLVRLLSSSLSSGSSVMLYLRWGWLAKVLSFLPFNSYSTTPAFNSCLYFAFVLDLQHGPDVVVFLLDVAGVAQSYSYVFFHSRGRLTAFGKMTSVGVY